LAHKYDSYYLVLCALNIQIDKETEFKSRNFSTRQSLLISLGLWIMMELNFKIKWLELKNKVGIQACWYVTIIPACGRLKQGDHRSEASLGYKARPLWLKLQPKQNVAHIAWNTNFITSLMLNILVSSKDTQILLEFRSSVDPHFKLKWNIICMNFLLSLSCTVLIPSPILLLRQVWNFYFFLL
jgi:hypothetical protein